MRRANESLLPRKSNKYCIFVYARARSWECSCPCVHVVLFIQHAPGMRLSVTSFVALCLHHIFRHYLINGTIFEKKLLRIKCVF
jgi:hypothetical protein